MLYQHFEWILWKIFGETAAENCRCLHAVIHLLVKYVAFLFILLWSHELKIPPAFNRAFATRIPANGFSSITDQSQEFKCQ